MAVHQSSNNERTAAIHEENDWGIVVEETSDQAPATAPSNLELNFAYEDVENEEVGEADHVPLQNDASVEEMMQLLRSI